MVIEEATSADAGVTVNTEQFFSLNNTIGRYVKFIGIGNSSSTNWTSVANVNIYGDVGCASLTSVFDTPSIDPNVTIFPVPVTNGILTISSTDKAINHIDIYSVTGQHLLGIDGKDTYSKQVDVTQLAKGVYIIKLEGLGHAKFVIK